MATKTETIFHPFAQLYGQQGEPILLLNRAIQNQCIHHAYIVKSDFITAEHFVGAFAQTLMCATQGCQTCTTCRLVETNNHPDLHWIRADSESKSNHIRLVQIKELLAKAAYCPVQSPFQFFVIEGAECLNVESSNALLKTLEEPPAATVFLLLTHYVDKILPTIRSRCQLLLLNQWSEQNTDERWLLLKQVIVFQNEKQRQERIEHLSALNYQDLILQLQFLQRQFWQCIYQNIQSGKKFQPAIILALEVFEYYIQILTNHANPKAVVPLFMAEFGRQCRPLKEWLL